MGGKRTLRVLLQCCREPLKNGLVQWAVELHSAGVPLHPADGALNRFEPIKFYPDTLSDRRPFYKFDFAALGGGIENSDAKTMGACAPKPDFGIQNLSVRAARIIWTNSIERHVRMITEKATLSKLERPDRADVGHDRNG